AALAAKSARPADIRRLRQHLEREREAIGTDRSSEAISLSAHFHIMLAEITGHSIFTEIVRDLVSRSSLIIALYWRHRDTTCKCDAHSALVDAVAAGKSTTASARMKRHIADLLSGLDLARKEKEQESLADILRPPP